MHVIEMMREIFVVFAGVLPESRLAEAAATASDGVTAVDACVIAI